MLRAIQNHDGRPTIQIGAQVRQRLAERRAARRVDQQIAAAIDVDLSLGDLKLALAFAEQRAGIR